MQGWIDYASKESFAVFEKVVELISSSGRKAKITYNIDHIAVSLEGSKRNFAWFSPRKSRYCVVELRVGDASLDSVLQECNEVGLDATKEGSSTVKMRLTTDDLIAKAATIKKVVDYAVHEGDGD